MATRLPRLIVTALLLALILPLNVFHFTNVIGSWIKRPPRWPTPILSAYRALAPFALVNHYGLFAQMTTTRGEIILEGSDDGVTWKAYEFRYKPGDLSRRPPQIAPFQPRLDWQMWFEALSPGPDLWFARFVDRLLTNAPAVTALLAHNPFPDHPPRFIRGQMYQYRFTTIEEHRATGQWWKRTPDRLFLPPVDHETLQRVLKRSI
jgi:hypothetical protein